MQGLIIGGNEGTRLRPLTIYTPKPIIQIVDRPLLSYQLDFIKNLDIKDVILTLGYESNKIDFYFGNGLEHGIELHYVTEYSPLGTAGTIKNSQSRITEPLLVINGDVLTDIDPVPALAFHGDRGAMVTILLTPDKAQSTYGLIDSDPDGRVTGVHDKPRADEMASLSYSSGIYIIEPQVLKFLPEGEKYSFESQLVPALIEAGVPVYACPTEGHWIELDSPQKYLQANIDLICGLIGKTPVERPKLDLPAEGDAPQIDRNSYVYSGSTIKSGAVIVNSIIGANCYIEERARVEYSVLLPGARIGKSTEVRGSVIGKGSIIGRSARVHNSILGDKSSLTDYTIS